MVVVSGREVYKNNKFFNNMDRYPVCLELQRGQVILRKWASINYISR